MTGSNQTIGAGRAIADGPDVKRETAGHAAPRELVGPLFNRPATSLLLRREEDGCRIVVSGEGGATLMSLGPFAEEDVIAVWRSLAATSGLPLAILYPDGTAEHLSAQIGRLKLGPIRVRRRLVVLNGRRPRFLVKRKFGRWPTRPLVYRECEIAGGRGA